MMTNTLQYLEHSAEDRPSHIAFADDRSEMTYAQVLESSRRVGSALLPHTSPRKPIPVLMDKSTETVCAFFGIVYAGDFYCLLDPKLPAERLLQILKTLEAEILITSAKFRKTADKLAESYLSASETALTLLDLSELLTAEIDPAGLDAVRAQALDTDLLYTNFTSGSTGVPKGVAVRHRSVIDFIDQFTELFGITGEDVIGNQAPFDFDVSVKDIYSTIRTGATMQIIPKSYFSFPTTLLDYLCDRNVTTLIWAVSALCIISTLDGFEYRVPEKINKILFSGEVMPIKHLNIWRQYLPDTMYVNVYGPTEITCNCTYHIADWSVDSDRILPIGKPFPNEHVFLLDDNDALVTEPGVRGELCVAGTCLAAGYYNNPEQTARAFVQNPLQKHYPETIYRTGDLAYYGEDGELYFGSRKDFQIKHNGHRIELGEVEGAIEKLPQIVRCCCLYKEDVHQLLAFYQGDITDKEIIKGLRTSLPNFMIPNRLIQVDTIPLTKNGKIDRRALMALAAD